MGTAVGVTPLANLFVQEMDGEAYVAIDLWGHDHPNGRRYVYLTTLGHGLQVIDVTDPVAPERVATYYFPGVPDTEEIHALKLRDTWAFVALEESGLSVLDVSNPTSPVEVARLSAAPFDGGVHALWVDGDWVYCTLEATEQLGIVNAVDPRNPLLVTTWQPNVGPFDPFFVHDLTVFDGVGYVACLQAGLRVVDLADPANPLEIGAWQPRGWSWTHSAWPTDDRTHVVVTEEDCDSQWGFGRMVDVRSLPGIVEVGQARVPDANPYDTAHQPVISGDYLYVAWYREGLQVFDVSDPTNPAPVASFATSDRLPRHSEYWCYSGAYGLWTDGCGLVYVADSDRGLWIVQVDEAASCPGQVRLLADSLLLEADACPQGGGIDGDGFASPGETLTVRPLLRNVGTATASGVSVAVQGFSSGITSASGTATFPDMPPGSPALAASPLTLVLSTAPDACGAEQWLDLLVSSDQGRFLRRFTLRVGAPTVIFADDFETDRGWTTSATGTGTSGAWERAVPQLGMYQPDTDDPADAGDLCMVTGAAVGADVDGLVVDLVSPTFDLSGYEAATLSYSRFFDLELDKNFVAHVDLLRGGATVARLEALDGAAGVWARQQVPIPRELLGAGLQVRFRVGNDPDYGDVEAALDNVVVTGWSCERCAAVPLDVEAGAAAGACGSASDSLVEPGEAVEILPEVVNRSDRPVSGISVVALSASAGWRITRAEAACPPLASGARGGPAGGAGLVLRVDPATACGTVLAAEVVARTAAGDSAPTTITVVVGSSVESAVVAVSDDFDTDPAAQAPTGWTTSSSGPPLVGVATDPTVEWAAFGPGPTTPPNAVSLGTSETWLDGTWEFQLSRTFDASSFLLPGEGLRVAFDAWLNHLEEGEWLELTGADGAGASALLWRSPEAFHCIDDNLAEWIHVEVDVDPAALDVATPLTLTFRARLDGTESGRSDDPDGAYVDTFRLLRTSRSTTCTPCAATPQNELFRTDVAALGPLDPSLFLVPPPADVSLAGAPWAELPAPGPDPRDPAALTNRVPLSLYQLRLATGAPAEIRLSKDTGTVFIAF